MIDAKLAESKDKLDRLLDLYLDKRITKENLIESETRLKAIIADLDAERGYLLEHLQVNIATDEDIGAIVTHCREVGVGLDNATIEDKQRYFDWLNVRGKLIIENGEKVVYAKCRIGERRLSLVQTSLLSNTGAIAMPPCVCLPILRSP